MPDTKVIVNKPLSWQDQFHLSEQVKSIYFERDENGNMKAMPVIVIDPSQDLVNAKGRIVIGTVNNNNTAEVISNIIATILDYPNGFVGVATSSAIYLNKIGVQFESQRTPTIWMQVSQQTGTATIWTPAGGKRFRLMGGIVCFAGPALAAAAINRLNLRDGATAILSFDFYCPLAAASLSTVGIPFVLPGNGYLSTAADAVLSAATATSLSAGSYSVSVWGTEE